MRFPQALRIGGREWRVRRKSPSKMGGNYGLTTYGKGTLDIATGQSPFDLRDTLLHETMHAILAQQGRDTYGSEEEELYVRALATGLMAVFQDNQQFAQWLIEPLTKK